MLQFRFLCLIVLTVPFTSVVVADSPPAAPVIIEPAPGSIVSAADVHLVTREMEDSDGDDHLCTTWEILDGEKLMWRAECLEGPSKVHAHLGDGSFVDQWLRRSSDYTMRVRFRSSSGVSESEWSPWSSVDFYTSSDGGAVRPMEVAAIDIALPHSLLDDSGQPVVPEGRILVANNEDDVLAEITSEGWSIPATPDHEHALKLILEGAPGGMTLPDSVLQFHDMHGKPYKIFLPSIDIEMEETVYLWVAANGSTHFAEAGSHAPVFEQVARMNPVPWDVLEPGFVVDPVLEDLQLPVDIAFPEPVREDGPLFYVAELYGRILAVDVEGNASVFAEDLLNFDPRGSFPGSGEIGIGGIVIEPSSGDLYISRLERATPEAKKFTPQVVRLVSVDGGWTMDHEVLVIELTGETMGPSHQISNLTFGPDGALYVHVADGTCIDCPQRLDSYRGKILRMNLDGAPLPGSPFYDASDGITATDFIYSWGHRNPFGGTWRSRDEHLYVVENGPSTDRFARVQPGFNYGWTGEDADMRVGALYNWTEGPAAPVRATVIQRETFAGSGFPERMQDQIYVTESGATWATGPRRAGKEVSRFLVTPAGELGDDRRTFVSYNGSGKGSAGAIAAGPDGLYFSDLYADASLDSPFARGAKVFRVRYVGATRFLAALAPVSDRCTYRFESVAGPGEGPWEWRTGEETYYGDVLELSFEETGIHLITLADSSGRLAERTTAFSCPSSSGTGLDRIDYDEDGGVIGRVGGVTPHLFPEDLREVGKTRLEGRIQPLFTQTYELTVETTGVVRLMVGDTLVLNEYVDGRASGRLSLDAGAFYSLALEVTPSDGAGVRLLWASDSQPESIIPASRLYDALPFRRRGAPRR